MTAAGSRSGARHVTPAANADPARWRERLGAPLGRDINTDGLGSMARAGNSTPWGRRAWLGSSNLTFLGKSAALPAQAGWHIEPRRAERKRCRCYTRVRSESPTPDGLARIPQARRFIKGYVETLNFRGRGGPAVRDSLRFPFWSPITRRPSPENLRFRPGSGAVWARYVRRV